MEKDSEIRSEVETEIVANERLGMILGILPDIDHNYLASECVNYVFDESELGSFIDRALCDGKYPKATETFTDAIDRNQWKEFDVERFIEKFPNPVEYFSRHEGASSYAPHTAAFLKRRFGDISEGAIGEAMEKNDSNLHLSFVELAKSCQSVNNDLGLEGQLGATESPPSEFFDAAAFTANHEAIERHLEERRIARQAAVEEARNSNQLLCCNCCLSDELLATDVVQCPEGHLSCKDCVLKSTEVLMGQERIDFPCLEDCGANFHLQTLEDVMPPESYEKLCRKLQEGELLEAGIEGLEQCPFCEYCAIPHETNKLFECPSCEKSSCRLCKKESHVPYGCDELNTTKSSSYAEEVAIEEARNRNELLSCNCCLSDELLAADVVQCPEGHLSCKDCVLKSTEVLLGQERIDFPCLEDCGANFRLQTLKDVMPPESYEKLCRKLQERELLEAGICLERCPFCEYCAIPHATNKLFECPSCEKSSCRLCKKESHIPYGCNELNTTKSSSYAEEVAIEEASYRNELLSCNCCFSDDLVTTDIVQCPEGHLSCKRCLLKSTEVLMGLGRLDFPCLEDCGAFFRLQTLKDVMPAKSYEKLCRKLQEREVLDARIEGLERCPFCEYCAIPHETNKLFECPICQKSSCRLCKKESHIPYRCNEDSTTKSRTYIEEKMSEALIRKCYKCGSKFVKEAGCNKIVCGCGARMCYLCQKPIYDYNVHFNEVAGCQMYTNNYQEHEEFVDRAAEKAIHEVKSSNPDIDEEVFKNFRK